MNLVKTLFLSFRDARDAFQLRRIMSGLMGRSLWHDLKRFPRDFLAYYKKYRNLTKEDLSRKSTPRSEAISKCSSKKAESHPVFTQGVSGAGRTRYTVLSSMRVNPGQQP